MTAQTGWHSEPVDEDAAWPVPVDEWFWHAADELVSASEFVPDDRPSHRAEGVQYGSLTGTRGGDGDGADAWRGCLLDGRVTGAIMTVSLRQRDVEVKLLVGCTPQEAQAALHVHTRSDLRVWPRPAGALLVLRVLA